MAVPGLYARRSEPHSDILMPDLGIWAILLARPVSCGAYETFIDHAVGHAGRYRVCVLRGRGRMILVFPSRPQTARGGSNPVTKFTHGFSSKELLAVGMLIGSVGTGVLRGQGKVDGQPGLGGHCGSQAKCRPVREGGEVLELQVGNYRIARKQ